MTFVHSDWGEQFNLEGHLVAWHNHFFVGWQFNFTGHVSGAEVELRLVALAEWRVASTLFFLEDVDFSLELGVRRQRAWSNDNLTALDLLALDTAQQQTSVVASLALVESFLEGFDTSYD